MKRSARRSPPILIWRALLTALIVGLGLGLLILGPHGFGVLILAIVIGSLQLTLAAPPVGIPINDENIGVVYKLANEQFFEDRYVDILIVNKFRNSEIFASKRIVCGDRCDAEVRRRKTELNSYYISVDESEYRINSIEKTITPSEIAKESCPSDVEIPKWAQSMRGHSMRAHLADRSADYIFLGKVRNRKFVPAEQLIATSPTRGLNCASEARAWYGSTAAKFSMGMSDVVMRGKWAPGEDFDYEFDFDGRRVIAHHRDKLPSDAALTRQFRLSFYRVGGGTVIISQIQAEIETWQENMRGRRDRRSPVYARCRDASRKSNQGSANGAAASRYFEGWTWLGAFEGKLALAPDGRLIGDLKVVAPPKDVEVMESPERVCVSSVSDGPSSPPHADGGKR